MARFVTPTPSPSPGKAPRDDEAAANRIAQEMMGGGALGPTAKDPEVFVQWGQAPPGVGGFALTPKVTSTVSKITGEYYTWDQKTKDKFLAHVELAGFDTRGMKDAQLAALWGSYVQQAASYYAQGRTVTPWDIMTKDGQQREAYLNTPRTVTQKSTQYDLSTEGDARAIFYTAAQQLLGRDPTKSEVSSFQKALNAMERQNPTVTTTTSNYVGDTLQSQESTSQGGVKEGARQMQAMDTAKAKPEYGAYQAATTYFDAMMEMLGGMS